MQVVIEDVAKGAHLAIESLLASVAEWGMSDVVNQGERLDQIGIQSQCRSNSARDLCDFYRVGKPVAKVIGTAIGENLRFIFETPKRAGMDNPIAIALKVRSVRMLWLWIAASARFFGMPRVGSVHVSESSAQQFSVISFQ